MPPSTTTTTKPNLALSTPRTANFPREVTQPNRETNSATSDKTPLSAVSVSSAFRDALPSAGLPSAGLASGGLTPGFTSNGPTSARVKTEEKTPITPPIAYMDFLRSMSLASPVIASPPLTGKMPLNRTSTTGSTASATSNPSSVSSNASANSDESDKDKGEESAPSTATSDETDVSCKCDHKHKSPKPAPAAINTAAVPSSPFGCAKQPLSAPACGPTSAIGFPSLKVPPSPAISNLGCESPARSPFSAGPLRSPFDWEAALKARRYSEVPGSKGIGSKVAGGNGLTSPSSGKRESRSSIRHIREVVTRTVTYTPRVGPAPKGKRRKVDHETAVES